jgi:hypothetical protein
MTIPTPRRIAVTSALALALFGSTVATASAEENEEIYAKYGNVTFEAYGEKITAATYRSDYGVRAYLHWSRNKSASVIADGLYEESRNLSIPEGTTVSLTMCYTKNGLDVKCGDYQLGEA